MKRAAILGLIRLLVASGRAASQDRVDIWPGAAQGAE